MSVPEHAVTVSQTVPFHDCDPMCIAWHGRYVEYMAAGRTELMKSCGLDIPEVRDLGLRMYITDVRCRYLSPMTYGDTFEVTAWFTRAEPTVRVAYVVYNVTQGRKAARGHTEIATTDAAGTLLTRLPKEVRERLPV